MSDYRVARLLAKLGWVDFGLGHSTILPHLLSRLCQCPISPGRNRQRVEQHKSKSTQPMFARRWAILYIFIHSEMHVALKRLCETHFSDQIRD